MDQSIADLRRFWSDGVDSLNRGFHPADVEAAERWLGNHPRTRGLASGVSALARWFPAHGNPDHNLVPVPFVGDLAKARIVILMGNPGAGGNPEGLVEHEAERKHRKFRDTLLNTLEDGGSRDGFYLRPGSGLEAIAPGYNYWLQSVHLGDLLKDFSAFQKKWILDHLLVLQVFPYHSKNMGRIPNGLEQVLPSSYRSREMAWHFLELARKGEIFLFFGRCLRRWGIEAEDLGIRDRFSGYQLNCGSFSLASERVQETFKPWLERETRTAPT